MIIAGFDFRMKIQKRPGHNMTQQCLVTFNTLITLDHHVMILVSGHVEKMESANNNLYMQFNFSTEECVALQR